MSEIKNIDPSGLNNFLEDERKNCYWFWFKGKITRKRRIGYDEIYEQNLAGKCEWNGIRFKNGFYNVFDVFLIKYTMSGKWNGQTKAEFDKNFKRVADIVTKADGDNEKQSNLPNNKLLRFVMNGKQSIVRWLQNKQVMNISLKFSFKELTSLDLCQNKSIENINLKN